MSRPGKRFERRSGRPGNGENMPYHLTPEKPTVPSWPSAGVPEPHRARAFVSESGGIAEARDLAAAFCSQLSLEWLAPITERAAQDALLVVSELVTNAGRHAPGPCLLELEGDDTGITVTVWDAGHDLPRTYDRDPGRVGGHGMEIVRLLCTSVTVEPVPSGKRIRARIDLPPV